MTAAKYGITDESAGSAIDAARELDYAVDWEAAAAAEGTGTRRNSVGYEPINHHGTPLTPAQIRALDRLENEL
jgi:hypothetical protein